MRVDPKCPIILEECDDPGCPKGDRCVLKDSAKLYRWCQHNPKHWLTPSVLAEAFDPVI